MKIKFFSILAILVILIASIGPGSALAGSYETSFVTSIVYQNIGSVATTTLTIYFYDSPDDTTPIPVSRPNLNPGAGTSVYIGNLTEVSPNFRGTAVLSADQPLAATLVQNPQSTSVKVQPLSSGFSDGTPNTLIATVLKNAFPSGGSSYYTVFSVQNAGLTETTIDIKFYAVSGGAPILPPAYQDVVLQPGAGIVVDAGTISQLGSTFNGSVVVESTGGAIVSSAMELVSNAITDASAFEGAGSGSTTFYMPSAACVSYGMSTAFAVQNTSLTTATNVTIFYTGGGQETKLIQPGSKQSFITCNIKSTNYLGAATIESATTNVIAMGKLFGAGASTAYLGFDSGSQKIALPYVRWGNNAHYLSGWMPRTNLAIQNVGGTTIAANQVTVRYVDRDGNTLGTHTIPFSFAPGEKRNSNPSSAGLTEFGCYSSCNQFGGSAIVEGPAGAQLAVIARNTLYINASLSANEDYNGTVMP